MKEIKIFSEEQINNNPVLKSALEECKKEGYNGNTLLVSEAKDFEWLKKLK